MLMQMKYTYKALGIKDTKTIAYTELVIRALNRRSNISFRYHETGSPFEYELIRFIYTKKRELDIMH
jgi:phospholipid-binding lipoprotein MlaA